MKALGSWQRKAILMHCVEQFKARKDELAMSLCIEAGKPIKVAASPHIVENHGLRMSSVRRFRLMIVFGWRQQHTSACKA